MVIKWLLLLPYCLPFKQSFVYSLGNALTYVFYGKFTSPVFEWIFNGLMYAVNSMTETATFHPALQREGPILKAIKINVLFFLNFFLP
jgi:hypothetical protein